MWLISHQGATKFWLKCDAAFTMGRGQHCDVVVQNDNTVTRTHLTGHVGAGGVNGEPASMSFVNSSKFGIVVRWNDDLGNAQKKVFAAEETWVLPTTLTTFDVDIGRNDLSFRLQWQPLPVFVKVPEDAREEVLRSMALAGAYEVARVPDAKAYVTVSIDPTTTVLAALCAGLPFIAPQHFKEIARRESPRQPPAELASETSMPGNLGAAWREVLGLAAGAELTKAMFAPDPRRRGLFSGATFVCVQPVLHGELSSYVKAAHGTLLLDALPPETGVGKTARAPPLTGGALVKGLRQFLVKHSGHVVAYVPHVGKQGDNFSAAVAVLQQLGQRVIEYPLIVRAMVETQRPPMLDENDTADLDAIDKAALSPS